MIIQYDKSNTASMINTSPQDSEINKSPNCEKTIRFPPNESYNLVMNCLMVVLNMLLRNETWDQHLCS